MTHLPHWRLTAAAIFHGIFGYSACFYWTVLSPIELQMKDIANQSIIAHYGVSPSEEALEWIWGIIASKFM